MQGFRRKMFFRTGAGLGLLVLLAGCPAGTSVAPVSSVPVEVVSVPEVEVLLPARTASLDRRLVPECSGFVASKRFPGIFWTHSDSGNTPTIVAIRADGSTVKPAGAGADYRGITLTGVKNKDWEAITLDGQGNLVVGDIGNNLSQRKGLGLVVCPEPDPRMATSVPARKIPVRYAGQTEFPDKQKRFDSEALFHWKGSFYVLTKRRMDTWTVLHRLEMQLDGTGVFHPVTSFDSHGLVTDAAVSPDGRLLAVLTYHGIWVFVLPQTGSNPLAGEVLHRKLQFPLTSAQVEAVSFLDRERLLIGSEQGDLYTVELSRLAKAR